MRIDEYGRVRFTRDGVRFVITANGTRCYERGEGMWGQTEFAMNRDRTARAVYSNLAEVSAATRKVDRSRF